MSETRCIKDYLLGCTGWVACPACNAAHWMGLVYMAPPPEDSPSIPLTRDEELPEWAKRL